MKSFNVIVADPIVAAIHIVRFALRQPHVCPIFFFLELTNLVVAEETRRFGEITVCGVLVTASG